MSKCEKINNQVLADHSQYIDLLLLKKVTYEAGVKLEPVTHNGKRIKVGHSGFIHISSDTGVFHCRQSQTNQTHYSFQVFVKSFMEEPIFRFESSGARHTNPKNYDSTLIEKTVKTPHFQKYNESGLSVAYRTEYIEENEDEVLSDINKGLSEFCDECTLVTQSEGKLLISTQLNIFEVLPQIDPHYNITFV